MKKFLKKNEIYFTTITSLLLGAMAIVVAYNANKIAKLQSKISYYENTPDFHLSRNYVKDSSGYAYEIEITLEKNGGKAKNISINIESYAHFELTDSKHKQTNRYIHLFDYFDQTYTTGENNGKIRLIKGSNNNRNFSNLRRILGDKIKENGFPYVFINDIIIAKINYTDFLNERRVEYYDISFGDGLLLDEGDSRIDLYKNSKASAESISIAEINEEKIQKYLEIILKKQ